MNKVLLDISSTQISDQRGSKKNKINIFSNVIFFIKKYFFKQKNFLIVLSFLSKLRQMKSFAFMWSFYTSRFTFLSGDILRAHKNGVLDSPLSNLSYRTSSNSMKWIFRDVNFCILNFQK
jgi:hypothetical protein